MGKRTLLSTGHVFLPDEAASERDEARVAESLSTFDPHDWDSVRGQFSLAGEYAYFAAFMLASHPIPVQNAIVSFRHGLDNFPERFQMGVADLEHATRAREAIARYTGTAPGQVALTDSTTMGLGLVYRGLRLRPGDEVLTTTHDFFSTFEALRLRAAADGAEVRRITLYEDPAAVSADQLVDRLRQAIGDRTRALALTWVHSNSGVMLPIRAVADLVAEVNADRDEDARVLLCVDGVQGFGVEDVDVAALGVDFFITGTHKWLFGPRGTGFVWGADHAWARLDATIPSFSFPAFTGWHTAEAPRGEPGVLHTPGGYHSFENRWALPVAFEFHEAIGRARIAERVKVQAAQLKEGLAGLPHVRLLTPRAEDLSSGLVCCRVDGMREDEVTNRLLTEHRISAGVSPHRDTCVRLGPSIVTTPDEVDRLVRAVASLR
ncbi:aminotransferase class V-fold PLP-dependent enzyme [Saccharothrix syringae]|nr:aminotransferase class V-fold PLP-dependent enzyme [Saccharothrix syringae]